VTLQALFESIYQGFANASPFWQTLDIIAAVAVLIYFVYSIVSSVHKKKSKKIAADKNWNAPDMPPKELLNDDTN
jgi:hypothetical protein